MNQTVRKKTPLRPNHLLQPTLFDKLRDLNPESLLETSDAYVMSRKQIQAIVQRDLNHLFNTISIGDECLRNEYPELFNSVFNYGMPIMTGNFIPQAGGLSLSNEIKRCIINYEPRITKETLDVQVIYAQEHNQNPSQITIEITGELYLHPYPLSFMMRALIDSDQQRLQIKQLDID